MQTKDFRERGGLDTAAEVERSRQDTPNPAAYSTTDDYSTQYATRNRR